MLILTSSISLNGLRLHGYHGVTPEEQKVGSDFIIHIKMEVPSETKGFTSDEISDTVNYAEVYESIREEFNKPSHLIECLAHRIIDTLFNRFPTIVTITLDIEKVNPPISADCQSASVHIMADR